MAWFLYANSRGPNLSIFTSCDMFRSLLCTVADVPTNHPDLCFKTRFLIHSLSLQIMRSSAGNVKRTKEEIEADPEQEDEFGYTLSKFLNLQFLTFSR